MNKMPSMFLGFILCSTFALAADAPPLAPMQAAPLDRPGQERPAADTKALQEKLETSRQVWEKWRDEKKGNYEYDVVVASWTGFSTTTTITVKGNKVVARKVVQRQPPQMQPEARKPPAPSVEQGWQETTADLGKNPGGAPPKTIDQLYQEAAASVAKGTDENQRWTTVFHPNGIIRCFGYADQRIMDDAPLTGARIENLRPSGN